MTKPADPRASLADWFVEQMRTPSEPRDEDAALRAAMARVLAEPGSNAAREALAVELRAQGDLRALLIEKQLRLRRHRLAKTLWTDEANALDRESSLLVRDYGKQWAGPIHGLVSAYAFHRGCLAEVTLPGAHFVERMPKLLELAPLQHVNLTAPLAIETVAASPLLARLSSLRISDEGAAFGDREATLLAESPHARNLAWISLTGDGVGEAGVEALAASEHLRACRFLDLARNPSCPTPNVWSDEGAEHRVRPGLAEELERRFGPRPWLAVPPDDVDWPPNRDDLASG